MSVIAGDPGLSGTETVWLTFVGAAFGSFVAVLLQSWLSRRGSKKHFAQLLAALTDELKRIEVESGERAARGPGDLRFEAPYPTDAWMALAKSAEVRRLGDHYKSLSDFYGQVAAANHRLEQVAALAQVAAMSPYDNVRMEYLRLAQHFSTESQQRIAERVGDVLRAVAQSHRKLSRG